MSGVEMVPVGELMVSRGGSVNPAQFQNEDFDLYSIPAFDAGAPEIAKGSAIGSTKQVVCPSDVLLSKIVPHIRRAWVVGADRGRRLIGSGEWIVFRSERAHPAYLKQVLVGDPFHEQFMQTVSGVGGSLLRARPAFVAGIAIPLPPLPEQRRIAAILDQADTLRTQRRAALAQLDSLTQSLFLDMFGDPVTNPMGWNVKRMSELFASTPIFGTMIPGDAGGGAWLCLRVANIQDWQLTLADQKYVDLPTSMTERHSVKDGDLLMARAIATQDHLGKCIVARPGSSQWAFDSHLMRLRFAPDRALPDFIRQALRTPGGRSIFLKASRKSSVQYNINTKEISALALPIPPLPLQQTFATRVQAIEALKTQHRAALAAQDALFAALQQRAFAGTL